MPPHWFMVTPTLIPTGVDPGTGEQRASGGIGVFVFRKSPVVGEGVLTVVDYMVDMLPMLDPANVDKYVANAVLRLAGAASNRLNDSMSKIMKNGQQ